MRGHFTSTALVRLVFYVLSAAMALGLQVNAVLADDVAIATPDPAASQESYDPAAQVAGETVVGLRFGDATGKITVNDIELPAVDGDSICVRARTRDGRFSATGVYKIKNVAKDTTRIRLSPVTSKYQDILSGYDMADLAVSAFVPSNGKCLPANALRLPILMPEAIVASRLPIAAPGMAAPRRLTLLINSSARRTKVTISKDRPVVNCEAVAGKARIAFDQICSFDVTSLQSPISVVVSMDDGFGPEDVPVKISLPDNVR